MENVCPIRVDINALNIVAVHIATQLWTLIDDKTFVAPVTGQAGERSSKETGAHNKVIVRWYHVVTVKCYYYTSIEQEPIPKSHRLLYF